MVLASRNAHKLRELGALLAPVLLMPLPGAVTLPPETGRSFEENALIKARAAARSTGARALADDSGIAVEALGGKPGIHSARYAGDGASDEQNLARLIHEVEGAGDRRAAYVCVLAVADPDGGEWTFEARCEGRLGDSPRGTGGFGYDPIFIPDEQDGPRERTMAELSPGEKDAISHRGRAARLLLAQLAGER
jgi:XTP/dITP diphosphohydrolase